MKALKTCLFASLLGAALTVGLIAARLSSPKSAGGCLLLSTTGGHVISFTGTAREKQLCPTEPSIVANSSPA